MRPLRIRLGYAFLVASLLSLTNFPAAGQVLITSITLIYDPSKGQNDLEIVCSEWRLLRTEVRLEIFGKTYVQEGASSCQAGASGVTTLRWYDRLQPQNPKTDVSIWEGGLTGSSTKIVDDIELTARDLELLQNSGEVSIAIGRAFTVVMAKDR